MPWNDPFERMEIEIDDDPSFDKYTCPTCGEDDLPPHPYPPDLELGSGKKRCQCCSKCRSECAIDV